MTMLIPEILKIWIFRLISSFAKYLPPKKIHHAPLIKHKSLLKLINDQILKYEHLSIFQDNIALCKLAKKEFYCHYWLWT